MDEFVDEFVDELDTARRILESTHTIALVGASERPERDSYRAMHYLLRNGFEVFPVNPRLQQIAGQTCYASVAAVPHPIDTVVCFRRSEYIGAVALDAIAAGAKHLWMQQGVINTSAAAQARSAGLLTVMDRCIMIDHSRLRTGAA